VEEGQTLHRTEVAEGRDVGTRSYLGGENIMEARKRITQLIHGTGQPRGEPNTGQQIDRLQKGNWTV
jgi:hypothetical protein